MNRVSHFLLRAIVLACFFFVIGRASAKDDFADRTQQYEGLKKEYDQKLSELTKARESEKPPEDVAKLRPSIEEFSMRFMRLATENPADAVGCNCLVWVASHGKPGKDLQEAIRLIEKHHLESPQLADVVIHLGGSENATGLMAKLAEKGGSQEVKGLACLYSAIYRYGLYCLEKKSDEKELVAIERLLERAAKDFADVRADQNTTIGQMANGWLHEVKHLQPGMKSPEIEGLGVDGKKMKLSDFKNRVVLLVFWSSSCGPCLADVPHYRKMMADLAGRPFTIIGVNCGDAKERVVKTMAKEMITWQTFLDGDLGEGPIGKQWNVDGLPTVYLISADGKILRNREFDLSEQDNKLLLERAIRVAEKK